MGSKPTTQPLPSYEHAVGGDSSQRSGYIRLAQMDATQQITERNLTTGQTLEDWMKGKPPFVQYAVCSMAACGRVLYTIFGEGAICCAQFFCGLPETSVCGLDTNCCMEEACCGSCRGLEELDPESHRELAPTPLV